MWETDWAAPATGEQALIPGSSWLEPASVEQAAVLLWMEHCIECAIPDCYSLCPLYVARADRKCARLVYGIRPDPSFRGLFDFGADVRFRRWGKLESKLGYGAATPERIRSFSARDVSALGLVNPVARALAPLNPERRLNGAYRLLRDHWLASSTRATAPPAFDEFVAEVWNPGEPVGLIVEVHDERLRFRRSLRLETGRNVHRIPFAEMSVDLGTREGRILVYPEHDAEARLVFTWLDFVRYTPQARAQLAAEAPAANGAAKPADASKDRAKTAAAPAAKVKVVAWDLDNTLWKGILVEDGADALTPVPEAIELIRRLDERGILNTIVSKNDHAQAWAKVTALGLHEMFVSPAINWGRKSANLVAVAEALNLGLDSFALVDDSAFERSEVATELPQVRVFPETAIPELLERPEFDVPVSAESKARRLSYLAEDTRKAIAASYGDDYDRVPRQLRDGDPRVRAARGGGARARARAHPAVEPAQPVDPPLYREELDALLASPDVLSVGWSCVDRYGDYGTVGFLSIALAGETPVLRDLVISCRVAKKKVENALFQWLADAFRARGHDRMEAWYKPTARNHVLLEALTDAGFTVTGERDGMTVLELRLDRDVPGGRVVRIDAFGSDDGGARAGAPRLVSGSAPARHPRHRRGDA
jgi:HAD superfamily phosphatase (TIGR01681 family)